MKGVLNLEKRLQRFQTLVVTQILTLPSQISLYMAQSPMKLYSGR